MSQAYQQFLLHGEAKQYTTINTHKGLFQYTRLPYGILSAPGIFQRNMENLLRNIPYVSVRSLWRRSLEQTGRSLEMTCKRRLSTAERQVCVHGTSNNLPGSQGLQGRHSTVARQGRCYYQCTSAYECARAQIVTDMFFLIIFSTNFYTTMTRLDYDCSNSVKGYLS